MKLFLKILISVLVCVGLGSLSGLVTADEISTWYAALEKPAFNPPNWIFAPVWTTLYALMGISFGLVWNRLAENGYKLFQLRGVSYFFIQFMLNLAWSSIFFSCHEIQFALVEIVILWFFIVLTTVHFYRFHKLAAVLLIPYILWVSFATALNEAIFYLN